MRMVLACRDMRWAVGRMRWAVGNNQLQMVGNDQRSVINPDEYRSRFLNSMDQVRHTVICVCGCVCVSHAYVSCAYRDDL